MDEPELIRPNEPMRVYLEEFEDQKVLLKTKGELMEIKEAMEKELDDEAHKLAHDIVVDGHRQAFLDTEWGNQGDIL